MCVVIESTVPCSTPRHEGDSHPCSHHQPVPVGYQYQHQYQNQYMYQCQYSVHVEARQHIAIQVGGTHSRRSGQGTSGTLIRPTMWAVLYIHRHHTYSPTFYIEGAPDLRATGPERPIESPNQPTSRPHGNNASRLLVLLLRLALLLQIHRKQRFTDRDHAEREKEGGRGRGQSAAVECGPRSDGWAPRKKSPLENLLISCFFQPRATTRMPNVCRRRPSRDHVVMCTRCMRDFGIATECRNFGRKIL
jgi:hypothetical protein